MDQRENGLTVAIATDDEKHFITRHFGDAERYRIYKLTDKECVYLDTVENTTEDEEIHADPTKAKNIAKILKMKGAQVLVSRAFGPNISRMIRKFSCILVREDSIERGLVTLRDRYSDILKNFGEGEGRSYLKI